MRENETGEDREKTGRDRDRFRNGDRDKVRGSEIKDSQTSALDSDCMVVDMRL